MTITVFQFKAGSEGLANKNMFDLLLKRALSEKELYKWTARAKAGDMVTLEVKCERSLRSSSQNSQFHVLVGLVAKESGFTFDEAKVWLKSLAVDRGYPQEVKNGKPVFFMGQPKGIPTHLASVDEMSILIDATKDVLISEFGYGAEELEYGINQ